MPVIEPGPLMVDVGGCQLSAEDRDVIAHPAVGGIVLFTRNYESQSQLRQLIAQIRAARDGEILIAVDHEGGRVQRFREGFTRIPPMRQFGSLYDADREGAIELLTDMSLLVATELAACDIDFSFAPCVDIDQEMSTVIGDRSFHGSVDAVVALGRAAINGYREGGLASVIKHFPGHGGVKGDTHFGFAVDSRSYDQIANTDMVPFEQLASDTTAVMPAHVIYPEVDETPASLSTFWQREVLRQRLGFDGVIVSDDLSMRAATGIAHQSKTAMQAVSAGTDLALICNDREASVCACENRELPVGVEAQVERRLRLKRKAPARQLSDKELRDIRSRLTWFERDSVL